MFQATIFDFNGVLADDEAIHLEASRAVAREEGLRLTEDAYYERYLAFDDWSLFRALYRDHGRELTDAQLEALVARKSRHYYAQLADRRVLFDGAGDAIRSAAEGGPVAIASGARRDEIEWILRSERLAEFFTVIIAAEDVRNGKPHPEPYLAATRAIAERHGRLDQSRCLAVEDSSGGIRSAKSAGLKCLALEQSYDRSYLTEADWVLPSIREFDGWIRVLEPGQKVRPAAGRPEREA